MSDLLNAVHIIRQFIDNCTDYGVDLKTEDGAIISTDWGYFEQGLDEIERYAKGQKVGNDYCSYGVKKDDKNDSR